MARSEKFGDRFVWAFLAVLLVPTAAFGQDTTLNIPDAYKNSVRVGGGGGFSFDNDSRNVSVTFEYGREISGPWGMSAGIGWDKDFSKSNGRRTQSQNFALQGGITFDLTENLGLLVGFAKNLIEKEGGNDWKSSGADEWSAGVGISYSFAINERVSIGPGLVVGYDFDGKEWRTEAEINVSFAF